MIYQLPKDLEKIRFYFNKLIEKECFVELKERKKQRTLKQNNYVHALFCLFGISTGYTLNETKQIVKSDCEFMIYKKDGKQILRSTADLNTKEMTDFVNWFRNWSSMKGTYLPSPDEYKKGYLDYEREIEMHKNYL